MTVPKDESAYSQFLMCLFLLSTIKFLRNIVLSFVHKSRFLLSQKLKEKEKEISCQTFCVYTKPSI